MRTVLTCLLTVIMSGIPAWAQDASRDTAPKHVILFGWDGAQRAHLHECLQRNELPTLKKLSQEGALVAVDVVTGATDTKAGWSQILTGYNPEVTGVFSNGRYRDIPEGYSVFERLEKHFGPDEFTTVAVIGKSGHCGEIRAPFRKRLDENPEPKAEKAWKGAKGGTPPKPSGARNRGNGGKIVEENAVKYLVFGGSPYYTMHKSCDVWEYGLMKDQKVGTRALELLEKHKDRPFFFFIHFAEVDHSGHKHGENSKEYNDALISNDTWTGKILDKLRELGLYEKTLVYITADHGFNEAGNGHGYAPYVFMGTNDPKIKRDGMRQDVAPTILSRFGLDLTALEPRLDGEPLTGPATKPVLKAPEKPARAKKPKRPDGAGQASGNGKASPAATDDTAHNNRFAYRNSAL